MRIPPVIHRLKKPIEICLTCGILTFLAGCNTTSSIQSVTKTDQDFSRYTTYAFTVDETARVVPGVNPAEMLWTEEIVELELARRGFKPVPADEAEALVSIEAEVTGGREKGGFSIGLGTGSYSRSGGSSVGVNTGPIGAGYIEQSTLTIRMLDAASKELLWVGWIDKLENNKYSQDEFKAKIREIMTRLPAI